MVHIPGGDTCLYTLLKKQNKKTENVTKSFTENNKGNIYIDCYSLSLITALQFYGGRGGQDNLATNLFIYVFQYRILCIIYLNILLSLCIAISNKFFLVSVEINGDE